jgi:hypothetical protein
MVDLMVGLTVDLDTDHCGWHRLNTAGASRSGRDWIVRPATQNLSFGPATYR